MKKMNIDENTWKYLKSKQSKNNEKNENRYPWKQN